MCPPCTAAVDCYAFPPARSMGCCRGQRLDGPMGGCAAENLVRPAREGFVVGALEPATAATATDDRVCVRADLRGDGADSTRPDDLISRGLCVGMLCALANSG